MRSIPRPSDEHSDAFDACISNFREVSVANSFIAAKPWIMAAGKDFLRKITIDQVSTIMPSTLINGVEMKQAMLKLYTDKLAKKGQPGRRFYDKWRSLAPNGRCPLCSVKPVSTLDHYLSKADFPTLAIYPFNLIPACRDCNTEKLVYIAKTYAEETLHPYFDDVDNETWLKATITHERPAQFVFSVETPNAWSNELAARIEKHMEVFNLYDLYSFHAAEELSNIAGVLSKLHQSGGQRAIRDHLLDALESRQKNYLNSWQTAMYAAMYNDRWFHSNGFNF